MKNQDSIHISDASGWIHDLTKAEASPEAEALYQLNRASSPEQAIEESSVDFLSDLRAYFQEFLRTFNSFSDGGKKFAEIKIFNLTQGAVDFMLYRNGMKLIVANTSHGVIQFSFDHHVQSSSTAGETSIPQPEEILAQMGVFGRVRWTYRSESVEGFQVAKHFFSEFVRVSREQKKVKPSQKVLLEQIKALLQEQGLSLD